MKKNRNTDSHALSFHSAKGLLGLTSQGLPVAEYSGQARVLGCLPPHATSLLPDWSSKKARTLRTNAGFVLPQTINGRLPERDYSSLLDKILDQKQTSACTNFSLRSAFSMAYRLSSRSRKTYDFNPFFNYGLVNGGTDHGAVISDILMSAMRTGLCLVGDIPNGAMFQNQFPASAFESAGRFKIVLAFRCTTYNDILEAIASGFLTEFGILVGQNFDNLDNNGVAPPPDIVRGGHALTGAGTKYINDKPAVFTADSWGTNFGLNGWLYLMQQSFQSRLDAFAIQAVSLDADSGPPPASLLARITKKSLMPAKRPARRGDSRLAA